LARARPGPHALDDPAALELRDRAEDVHLELAGGRCGVDALAERDECDAERLQVLEQRDQVLQVAPKAIEPPAHQYVKLPAARVFDEAVEGRPGGLGPAHAVVDVLHGRVPATGGHVAAELGELVLGLLVERGDTGVDGGAQRETFRHGWACHAGRRRLP
jgi:hypothetical protein